MEDKRRLILEINKRTDIDLSEKSRLINQVMSSNRIINHKIEECPHYERNCLVFCEICNDYFNCRMCHDEQISDHEFNRFKVSKMKCKLCNFEQECNQTCINCNEIMGKYYCKVCNLFENRDKNIIHCDKCGICRVCHIGSELIHCDKCNMCYPSVNFENHQCVDRYDDICPLCNENIRNSTKITTVLPCNHLVHSECLKDFISSGNYQCPICKKSVMKMDYLWERIEQYVNSCQMPEEFQNKKTKIFCNDCHQKTETKFHFEYHKCQSCNGWNTSILDVI